VKFRLLGDPTGEIVETISLPSTVGDFDFFPGSTSAPTSEPGGVSPRTGNEQQVRGLTPSGSPSANDQPPSPLPLRISSLTNVMENDGRETSVMLPAALNGIIAKPFEEDVYRLTVKKGERYSIEVFARSVGSPLDPKVWIRRADSSTIEIEGDDTPIGNSRFYSASGSIQRKEQLDPSFVWEPKEDGEYVLGVTDMRGLGDPQSVYRVEIEPAHDSINTYLFARVIDSMQCPRLTTATVPRGNRWTVTFNLKEGLGNRYRGPLELFATGLPDGVQMIVPPILPGQSSVPVQFVASDDVQPQSRLIEVQARAANVVQAARLLLLSADKSREEGTGDPPVLRSRCQESFPFLSHSGGRAWHPVSVERYVLAVTERSPFTIEITQPRGSDRLSSGMAPRRCLERPGHHDSSRQERSDLLIDRQRRGTVGTDSTGTRRHDDGRDRFRLVHRNWSSACFDRVHQVRHRRSAHRSEVATDRRSPRPKGTHRLEGRASPSV
ncbi:MAG: hypothetical protein NTZ32_21680, partial [Planctomycetales bacterium]|nr:hypothetical protein [Planctomycetales bacterium]